MSKNFLLGAAALVAGILGVVVYRRRAGAGGEAPPADETAAGKPGGAAAGKPETPIADRIAVAGQVNAIVAKMKQIAAKAKGAQCAKKGKYWISVLHFKDKALQTQINNLHQWAIYAVRPDASAYTAGGYRAGTIPPTAAATIKTANASLVAGAYEVTCTEDTG